MWGVNVCSCKKSPMHAWVGGVSHAYFCVTDFPPETFFFFVAVTVTGKWSQGLKEQMLKAVTFSVIVMYCGYFFFIALTTRLAVKWTIQGYWGHVDLFSSGYNNVQISWTQGCLKLLHLPCLTSLWR